MSTGIEIHTTDTDVSFGLDPNRPSFAVTLLDDGRLEVRGIAFRPALSIRPRADNVIVIEVAQ